MVNKITIRSDVILLTGGLPNRNALCIDLRAYTQSFKLNLLPIYIPCVFSTNYMYELCSARSTPD